MRDTSEEIEIRFREGILKKSPAERLAMACRMFDTAKALIQAGEKGRQKGKQSSETLQQEKRYLFFRLYRQDFTSAEAKKILRSLKASK